MISVDDTPLFRQDPFVTLVAPTDGVYVIRIRETNFGGGDNHRYVLHLGTFSRPAAVFPAGGQAGTEVAVKFFGIGEERTVNLKLPVNNEFFELYPSDAGGTAPTANPFRVSPFPNVNENEPNDESKQTTDATAWPVAFNGIIEKPGDVDHFRFRAKRGDMIDVSAFAFRIGSPLDTVVAVLDSNGELLASNDDDETHDSKLEVTIPADGEYCVRVTDKRKQGGPAFIYRVELTAPKPALSVFLADRVRKSQDRHIIAIPRGNRVTAHLAVRRDGVTGPVVVTSGELPNGVKVTLGSVPEGEYLLPVVFEASADAPMGGKLVDFFGTAETQSTPVVGGFSQEVTLVRGPGDSAIHAVTLSKLAVVVVEESPMAVQLASPTTSLVVDGTLDVVVRVTRGKDLAEPVEISFPVLPPGVEAPTSVVIPANSSEAIVTLVAGPSADLGTWKLVAEASLARPGRANRDPLQIGMNGLGTGAGTDRPRRGRRSLDGLPPVASEVVSITLAKAPVKGQFAETACEQGKSVKVVCDLEGELPAGFKAKLDGLPPRATAAVVEVKPAAKRIEFMVSVHATTPLGDHRSLVCELAGEVDGSKVAYRIGRDGMLKVDAPGTVKIDAAGKPLSPLESLRLERKKP
jgi:hypothetical protein